MSQPQVQTDLPKGKMTREKIKNYLVQRFHTRAHMTLILMSSGLAAMIGNWIMLHAGVSAMWVRYPIAVSLSYLTFLAGVWLWLRFMGMGQRSSLIDSAGNNLDLPNLSSGGGSGGGGGGGGGVKLPDGIGKGGGEFGGGGASGSWSGGAQTQMMAAQVSSSHSSVSSSSISGSSGGGSSKGFSFSGLGDIDGDGIILLVLAALLIASILLVSGYIVWMAPDILSEALFGAALAGGVARPAQGHASEGWAESVIKKTWWPFAIVLVVSLAFAIYAAIHYPGASTFGQAIAMVLN
jgi:hypothetical protein